MRTLSRKISLRTLGLSGLGALLVSAAGVRTFGQSLEYVPVITTYAGGTACTVTASDTIGDGCPATQASFSKLWGSVADRQGNLYLADQSHDVVRRIDAVTGIITTVAGLPTVGTTVSGTPCSTVNAGDGCPATQATLNAPNAVAFDPFGNLVIADTTNNRVRIVNAQTGIISTLLGTGKAASAVPSNTNPQPANATAFSSPAGLAFDRAGNLYVTSDGTHSVALVVASNGVIDPATSLVYNLAGTGTGGSTNDSGGAATQAELYIPRSISVAGAGGLLVTNYDSCTIVKITSPFQNGTLNLAGATISTVAGNGSCASSAKVATNQPAGDELTHIENGKLDNAGNFYFAQYANPGDSILALNLASGTINPYAGNGSRADKGDNGPAVSAELDGPADVSFDNLGDGFTMDYTSGRVRRVSLGNVFLAPAIVGTTGSSQDVVAEAAASLTLQSAAISSTASPSPEFAIGALSGCSTGSTLAQGAYCTVPVTFTAALPGLRSAALVLSDASLNTATLGLTGIGVAPAVAFSDAVLSTVAGAAVSTQISAPRGGAVDATGNVYFADSGNNVIRKVTPAGTVSTVAGTGTGGYAGDGAAATLAQLNAPVKVAVDAAGNLFIADSGNNVIRLVSVDTGIISTLAGTGSAGYAGDGGLATAAQLSDPQGLAVDRGGNLYVADTGNNVIRFFTPGGLISTFSGTGQAGYSGDNGPAQSAQLTAPAAVTLDTAGNLYVADTGNAVIREISLSNQITTVAGKAGESINGGDGGAATSATLVAPSDLVVDAAGDLYIAAGTEVRLVNLAGTISTIAGMGTGTSYSGDGGSATEASLGSTELHLMLDGAFNLYISDTAANRVLLTPQSSASALSFSITTPGETSATKTVSLWNTGSSPLAISALTISPNFVLQSGDPSACTTTTALAAGQACSLDVAFSPAASALGSLTGTITITDNALNNPASTQTIALSGNAAVVAATTTIVTPSASTLTYGYSNTVTVTASVAGSGSPSGMVSFTVNGTTVGSATLSSGQASIMLPALGAGSLTVNANYLGDASNASSTGSASITVNPAVLTVTAANATIVQGDPIPALTYTITGLVNGDTVSVLSGSPLETTSATSSSAVGAYPINITANTLAAANYSFTFVSGVLTIQPPPPPDYSIDVTPPSQLVPAGQIAVYTVTLTLLRGYAGSPVLSCSGLPAGAACSFSGPFKGLGSGNPAWTQVNIQTSGGTGGARGTTSAMIPPSGLHLSLAMGLHLCWGCILLAGRRRRSNNLLGLVALAGLALGMSACSGSGGKTAATGTYQVVITAVDPSASLSHSATVTLTVQ